LGFIVRIFLRDLIMGVVFSPLCCSAELSHEEAQLMFPALRARFTLTPKIEHVDYLILSKSLSSNTVSAIKNF
jgi:hypothetical protein